MTRTKPAVHIKIEWLDGASHTFLCNDWLVENGVLEMHLADGTTSWVHLMPTRFAETIQPAQPDKRETTIHGA